MPTDGRSRWGLFCLAVLVCWGSHSWSKSKTRYSYSGDVDANLGSHVFSPQDFASQRLGVSFQQNAEYGTHWTVAVGVSGWKDFVYQNRHYVDQDVARQDATDLRARNAFAQYRTGALITKVGFQQVVWGETFGNSIVDIVNPKDYRNGYLSDLSQMRLQTPMINSKYIAKNFSIQGIFIPKAYTNLIPAPGNDYAFPFRTRLGILSAHVQRESTLPFAFDNTEYGARISTLLSGFDLSVFYFNYVDRNPWYSLNAATTLPNELALDEHHSRVTSVGLTLTKEFAGFVLRMEGMLTPQRRFPLVDLTNLAAPLTSAPIDDRAYVVELNSPTWAKFNFGLQWANDFLQKPPPGLLRTSTESIVSAHVQRPMFQTQSFELLYSYALADSGQRWRATYNFPLSGHLDFRLEGEVFAGPTISEFGRIRGASRIFAYLKFYFKEGK